jgi:PhoH-like ATPase
LKKNYVLDTNVLLSDPDCLKKFDEHNVVIPICVLEELDNFKKDPSELGRNARQVARNLDGLREQGSLIEGVLLPGGGTLKVISENVELPSGHLDKSLVDNTILGTCKLFHHEDIVVLVTKDINLRVRADALDIFAEDYLATKLDNGDSYTGVLEVHATDEAIDEFYKTGVMPQFASDQLYVFYPNQYAVITSASKSALAKWDNTRKALVPLNKTLKNGAWGLRPRNKEQTFALDLLLDDNIKLVTLSGHAGGGKTLIACAAALQKTVEEELYAKVLVSRPIMPMGKDIGFLPGDIAEKMNPWMQPIYDSFEFLMGLSKVDKKSGRSYEELEDMGMVELEPLTYIRGRSIPNQYMIVDEAQNLTIHELKTILTRAGEGTKIVLTGDPDQIDNPYVDKESNGFSMVIEKFKDQKLAGHITLQKCERSALAELAASIL